MPGNIKKQTVTAEKLKWISKNLRHGDKTAIASLVNGVTYPEVVSILKGDLFGRYGAEVIEKSIIFLLERIKSEKADKKKFSKITN